MKLLKYQNKEDRYDVLLQILRGALNRNTFNTVVMQDICKAAGVDSNVPSKMVVHGILLRGVKSAYKSTEKLYTITGAELVDLLKNKPMPSPAHVEQGALDLVPKINIDLIHDNGIELPAEPFVMSWERVPCKEKSDEDVYRAKVPGGWLVKSYFCAPYPESITQEPNSASAGVTMNWLPQHALAFIPDPAHVWAL